MALTLTPGAKLVAATHNPGKARELAALLEGRFEVVAAGALGLREPDERVMSRGEALEVLGLEPGADEAEIRDAHKRLLRLVHPDHGGSAYLATRVYQARDTLLDRSRKSVTRTRDDERA